MPRTSRLLFAFGLLASISLAVRAEPAKVLVHEWGTFTSLQNEAGETIGGINTDDEPLPPFVHRIIGTLLIAPGEAPPAYSNDGKGVPGCHPDVTLRLETPVLYFHLPPGQGPLTGVTVTARFRGGWLSEFYPQAVADAPGILTRTGVGRLRPDTIGRLEWNDLTVGADGPGPASTAHVWNAPRAVAAQSVRTAGGETERFLFYRGVAHIDAPLVAVQDAHTGQLMLRSRLAPELARQGPLPVSAAWLVDVRADGAVAFRGVPALVLGGAEGAAAPVDMRFGPQEYARAHRAKLADALRQALVTAGLFDDEAQALLATWELSYFRSAGTRVFYLVPRAWTDHYLPLAVSVDAQITRVMVGRIELVTPRQRHDLEQIGRMSARQVNAQAQRMRSALLADSGAADPRVQDVMAGRLPLQASGVPIPDAWQRYLALGRFRAALVLDEAARHPTPGMAALISAYGLEADRLSDEPGVPAQAARR